jgi:hypothetical protein
VITVIEVLSPSNKAPGAGQNRFLRKRQELLDAHVTLVEIDLLRGGERLLPVPIERLPDAYRTPYQVCVRRGWQPTSVEIYRLPIQERLPAIRVPLRPSDQDAPLDLQALIDQCYRDGDYEEDIDYQQEPDPRLTGPDARWADALLRKKALRRGSRNGSKRRPGRADNTS